MIPDYWIDTQTGTWGSTEGLVLLDITVPEILEGSDSQIINYGLERGAPLAHFVDDDELAGIILTRGQLDAWAGTDLTDEEMERLAEAIPNSSIPDAVNTIVNEAIR